MGHYHVLKCFYKSSFSFVSADPDPCDPGLSLSPGRSVMAEPDYLEVDCDELIKPKKLINPVKNSRNHQDLHRELLMNQKRSAKGKRTHASSVFISCCLFYSLHKTTGNLQLSQKKEILI